MALSSEIVNFGEAGPDDWWADRGLATVRLSARSADASAVFIGIAPSADVAGYLGSASYDKISDLRTDPFGYSLTRRGTGGDLSTGPTDQGFWTAQSSGPGTQALTWDLEPGTYTAVVMNVDGSPGVAVDLSAGGRLGWLTPLAWSLGLLGGALILGGALLVVYGALPPGPRVPRQSSPGQPPETVRPDTPVTLVGAKDPQLNRGLWLVKWFLALPHLIVLGVLAGTWQLGDADGFLFAVGGLIGALTLAAGLLLLFTGRYPAALFDLLVGLNRWVYRVTAYVALMTDTYPPFRLDQGPADPGGVAPTPSTPDAPATTGVRDTMSQLAGPRTPTPGRAIPTSRQYWEPRR